MTDAQEIPSAVRFAAAPKKRKKKYPVEALFSLAGGAFFLGGFLVWASMFPIKQAAEETARKVAVLESLAVATGDQVRALSLEITTSSTTRDVQGKLFEEQLALLSAGLSMQQSTLQGVVNITDVSTIAFEWDPFVYRMGCFFRLENDDVREDRGSATIEQTAQGPRLLTSKHIIERKDTVFEGCVLTRPGSTEEIKIKPAAFIKNESVDFAYAFIDAAVVGMPSSRRCASKPSIGDRVLILGYPGIGSKESVTATEGIISGFDADMYTTSAKIEKGNSGGAVVDVEENCFLGIPASVLPGNVESLARILPLLGL